MCVVRFYISVRGVYWPMKCIDSLREVGLDLWQHYRGIHPLLSGAVNFERVNIDLKITSAALSSRYRTDEANRGKALLLFRDLVF